MSTGFGPLTRGRGRVVCAASFPSFGDKIGPQKGPTMGFEFGTVLVFAVVAVGFALGGITASRLVGPRIPNAEKASIYECGERPIGRATGSGRN